MTLTNNDSKSLEMDKRVLITGASSGLGKELALLYAQKNRSLLLVARSKKKLEKISMDIGKRYNVKVAFIVMDLGKSDSAYELFKYCQKSNFQIDLLINNAGFAYRGEFLKEEIENISEMLYLMVLNTALLTRLFGHEMQKKSEGKIVQISSTAAFQAGPYMAVYFAAKSFLLLLSEAIQFETKYPKIQIACPGAFHSNFEKRSKMQDNIFFKRRGLPDAAEMAKKMFNFAASNKSIYVPGFRNNVILLLIRFFPRKVVHWVISIFLSKKKI
ncbi:SDR family NAD(P)-dependent oxidoreductase [Hyphobacterium sp. CCMP332]|nr:SDR family NAD(P)-dependent oxidoreductase [Hyphobacterium sp. CCMP332]